MQKPVPDDPDDPNITMTIAGRELTIRDRYETASIVNDALIAVEFFVGSFFFFEAEDLQAAIEVAAKVPAAGMGGAVEVREVVERPGA